MEARTGKVILEQQHFTRSWEDHWETATLIHSNFICSSNKVSGSYEAEVLLPSEKNQTELDTGKLQVLDRLVTSWTLADWSTNKETLQSLSAC